MSSDGATSSTGLGPCFSAGLDAGFDMGSDMGLGAGRGMLISDGSSGAMIGPRARCGLANSGSRTAWLPRAAGASPPGASAWKPNGPSHASSTRPILPFFRTLRPRLARTPARRTLAVRGRASRLLPARFGLIFALEGLPQPLQFEDQRRALRPGAVAIRFVYPQSRRSFVGVHGVDDLHDETLSASDGRGSAFACGGGGSVLPFAALTRANTSALGPNAISLPS